MDVLNVLISYFIHNSSFNATEIKTICSFFEEKSLLKDEPLFEQGKYFSKIAFVAEGILRSYVYNDNGEDITKHFIQKKEFLTEIDSFEYKKNCAFNVSAVTLCKLLLITKSNFEIISQKLPDWNIYMKNEAVKAMNSMIRKQEFLIKGEAIDKYKYFIENYPDLAKQVPLKYIASYLHINQSTLSRIRKRIV